MASDMVRGGRLSDKLCPRLGALAYEWVRDHLICGQVHWEIADRDWFVEFGTHAQQAQVFTVEGRLIPMGGRRFEAHRATSEILDGRTAS